ncbi:hypothetical protein TNCV_4686181 [Trichonephila clavipes]|nr:hypothetical protein TNCV_4686181 [Trichonephila clavipes]
MESTSMDLTNAWMSDLRTLGADTPISERTRIGLKEAGSGMTYNHTDWRDRLPSFGIMVEVMMYGGCRDKAPIVAETLGLGTVDPCFKTSLRRVARYLDYSFTTFDGVGRNGGTMAVLNVKKVEICHDNSSS